MLDHAERVKRVFFPSHNYKHAPVIKAIRKVLESEELGAIHLVTLDTFRTTHAKGVAEWQPLAPRPQDQRRRHRDGPRQPHVLPRVRLARVAADGDRREDVEPVDVDTEDNFNCTVTFPGGIAVAQLTWNSGFRKVIYTLHGEHGAIKVEDDDIEIHRKRPVARSRSRSSMRRRTGWMRRTPSGSSTFTRTSFARSARASGWARKPATPRCASS